MDNVTLNINKGIDMLLNKLKQIVTLKRTSEHGVTYDPQHNEFTSAHPRDARRYEMLRRDLVEVHVARTPERGMFSLEQRARIKLA